MTYKLRGLKENLVPHRWFKNLTDEVKQYQRSQRRYVGTKEVLEDLYGVSIIYNDGPILIFETESDATMFVLRWS